jgi:cytidylate kinase
VISEKRLPVVAIDGPAAAGKTTVARGVAARLGMRFFDTGLLYRAVTLVALRRGIPLDCEQCLADLVESLTLELDQSGSMIVDGHDVTRDLRTPEVDAAVSLVSAQPSVRRALFNLQRRIAEQTPVVMVGRDITTVVVPDAAVRIYLNASAEERARRRHRELRAKGSTLTLDEVLADTRERDRKDSTRKTAPLRAGPDVDIIETDGKPVDEVIDTVVQLVRERIPGAR